MNIGKFTKNWGLENWATILKKSSWIHDAELDDAILGAFLEFNQSSLRICTADKDGGILYDLKSEMFKAVVGELTQYEVWMNNFYKLSAAEKKLSNRRKIKKQSEILENFCKSFEHLVNSLPFVPLIVTAPTFGILEFIYNYFKKPLLVFAYTGQYNLGNMNDLKILSESQKAFVVDTSRYPVICDDKGKEPQVLTNFYHMTHNTPFWEEFKKKRPDKCKKVKDFLKAFNTHLIQPGRLFTEEFKKDEVAMKHLDKLFNNAVSCQGINCLKLRFYVKEVNDKYMSFVKNYNG